MSRSAFDAEVKLDLAVNFIPFAILCFFVALFAAFNPWGFDLLRSGLQFAVVIATAALLLAITYVGARAIEGDERRDEPETDWR